jgi:hypothetical protein
MEMPKDFSFTTFGRFDKVWEYRFDTGGNRPLEKRPGDS